ncbi:MAG: hypothetical protein AAF696_30125, partial [Bacteroidota bacterium]
FFIGLLRIFAGIFEPLALLQMGLSLLSFFLFLRLYKLIYKKNSLPLWMLAFLFLYPAQFIYSNLIMAEILFQFLLMLSLYTFMKGWENSDGKYFIVHALALAAALLCKPVMYLLIPIHFLSFLYLGSKRKSILIVISGLIPLLILGTYTYRNYQLTDYVHVSSVQNINLIQYPVAYVLEREIGKDAADAKIDDIHEKGRAEGSFAAEQTYWAREIKEILLRYPLTYVGLHAKGMFNFFLDPGRFDLYHVFEISNSEGLMAIFGKKGYKGIFSYLSRQPIFLLICLGGIFLLNMIKLLAFLYMMFQKKTAAYQKWAIVLLVGYLAGVTGVMGASRFAVPVYFMLLLCLPPLMDKAHILISKLGPNKRKAY